MYPKGKKIPRNVYFWYTLLNLPSLAALILVLFVVRHWLELPGWLTGVIIAGWIIKDVMLFPFVWRAYDQERQGAAESLVGQTGIVIKRLNPSGYVQVRGERWKAETADDEPPIEAGRCVRIQEMRGLTLYVEPDKEGHHGY